VSHDSPGRADTPRPGYCNWCGDETQDVVPHGDGHICRMCAHTQRRRVIAGWDGASSALLPGALGGV
jgi:hypothetical protein